MDLSKRKEDLQKEFASLQDTRKGILESAKKLQQELTATDNRIQQVSGAYNVLVEIEKEPAEKNKKTKV